MTDLMKFQTICELLPDEKARKCATNLAPDESLNLVRNTEEGENPNGVLVHFGRTPIAWIPGDIEEDLAACLDKGYEADVSVMRVELDDSGEGRAVEVLIFVESPEQKDKEPLPAKKRIPRVKGKVVKDRSDLVASAWIGLGALIVLASILFFLYWIIVRPALQETEIGARSWDGNGPVQIAEVAPAENSGRFMPIEARVAETGAGRAR